MSCSAPSLSLPRLGRLPAHGADHPHHRVKFAAYLAPGLSAPASVDWTPAVNGWGLYDNDQIGDCAVAAPANLARLWTANTGAQRDIPVDAVRAAYTSVAGFDPANPDSDKGCVISDVLKLWHAFGIGGDVTAGFAEVDHSSPYHMQLAIALMGGCIVGVNLPKAAQGAASWDTPADLTGINEPGSWGGHAVALVSYDSTGCTVVTWGGLLKATWGWLAAYCDEAWAVVSADWLRDGHTPAGLDLPALLTDLRTIADVDP